MTVDVSDASGKKTANYVAERDENIKSMSRYFDPPLTYQSVE